MRVLALTSMLFVLVAQSSGAAAPPNVTVGSKQFTESVILGEIATQLARTSGANAEHRRQLGGTRVLWDALVRGEIDLYPEYTGTLTQEILAKRDLKDERRIREALRSFGIEMSRPLGFNNTYAIGMREQRAQQLGIRTLSDLRQHPELSLGFSNEFMERRDGWPGLRDAYRLPQTKVTGLDHDLAYRAISSGSIDATDLYSTDAEIQYYHLRVLADDQSYFPEYKAVFLYRADLRDRAPKAVEAIERLQGRIDETQMIRMNARAKLDRVPEPQVAADFLAQALGVHADARVAGTFHQILRRTYEHLLLVGISLAAAIVAGVPLGIIASKRPKLGQGILGVVAAIYTIPSLALLVFMIPLLGIGAWPAIVALFLYSLLPIVRNTEAGLRGIAPELCESAEALGLPAGARLLRIELPLASGAILAGIKTSAVVNVGTATLGALIGAGGYGQPILTGIRLDNIGLILQGAVPAALLALLISGGFDLLELLLVPAGLRTTNQPARVRRS